MNKVILQGNLCKDPEMKYLDNGTALAKTSIAVRRRFKNKNGENETDFFNLVAFGKTAEFLNTWFVKGQQVIVSGELNTRSWENDEGKKQYATDVKVDEVYFTGSKKEAVESTQKQSETVEDDSGLPF